MSAVEVTILSIIISVIVCSVISCFFLYQVSTNLAGNKKKSARSFFFAFLFLSLAFVTMASRNWFSLTFSVFVNNALYITASHLLLCGVAHWYRYKISRIALLVSGFHIALVSMTQIGLYLFVENSFNTRVYFGGINNAIVYWFAASLCYRQRLSNKKGETYLGLALSITAIGALLPSIAMVVSHSAFAYQLTMVVTQNIGVYFVFGALLSLFLFDEAHLHYLRSIRDELTGIYNRRYFREEINKLAQVSSGKATVAIIDIDYFKRVNDNYGHHIGDKAIKSVAKFIDKQLNDDCILARYGGEEFIIYAPWTSSEVAQIHLDRIRSDIEMNFKEMDELPLNITVSIGYVMLESTERINEFFNCADQALYRAKDSGRNCVNEMLANHV
ncbi:GGDEF domain-containing protein [Vibrio viridaestus]|uniref:diguanylate cyclase n=1 Tax=Vibrio viridaestus TaxID=2487322 RepID=A0A3N9TK97_9VIBR|nr:GGDEF domain-containing protein [Vibrio viridaestus]RQW64394.1 GGDEF domain-containing protein [Vibrio viridaestus]